VLAHECRELHQRFYFFHEVVHVRQAQHKAQRECLIAQGLSRTYTSPVKNESPETKAQHPLKKLRQIIGLSQAQLAARIGINLQTIRSAEILRRGGGELTNEQATQVFLSIGAWWSGEEWLFTAGDFGRHVPYTRAHYDEFITEMSAESRERASLTYYLALKLISILENARPLEVNGLFWRINHFLDSMGAKPMPFTLAPQWDAKELRTKGFRKIFQAVSEEDEKGFKSLPEQAKAEREAQLQHGVFVEPGPGPKVVSGRTLALTPEQHEAASLIARAKPKPPKSESRSRQERAAKSKSIS
jgi:transcriptional regulator with XRE-family HTH domain